MEKLVGEGEPVQRIRSWVNGERRGGEKEDCGNFFRGGGPPPPSLVLKTQKSNLSCVFAVAVCFCSGYNSLFVISNEFGQPNSVNR